MIEMEVFKQDLNAVRNMLDEAGKSLQIDHLREQLIEYNEDMGSPGFWDDTERAQRVSAKASSVEGRIKHYESLISRADDIEVMMELAEEADDESMVDEIRTEFDRLKEESLPQDGVREGPAHASEHVERARGAERMLGIGHAVERGDRGGIARAPGSDGLEVVRRKRLHRRAVAEERQVVVRGDFRERGAVRVGGRRIRGEGVGLRPLEANPEERLERKRHRSEQRQQKEERNEAFHVEGSKVRGGAPRGRGGEGRRGRGYGRRRSRVKGLNCFDLAFRLGYALRPDGTHRPPNTRPT